MMTEPAIQEVIDPASEFVAAMQKMADISKFLRAANFVNKEEIIVACQEVKRNMSYIEDWAFRYGK